MYKDKSTSDFGKHEYIELEDIFGSDVQNKV